MNVFNQCSSCSSNIKLCVHVVFVSLQLEQSATVWAGGCGWDFLEPRQVSGKRFSKNLKNKPSVILCINNYSQIRIKT